MNAISLVKGLAGQDHGTESENNNCNVPDNLLYLIAFAILIPTAS